MSALRKPIASLVPAVDVFRERCQARAILVEACLFDLQDAVDGLQETAVSSGLIDDIGQDAVQKMMAEAFAIVPRAAKHSASLPIEIKPRPGAATSTMEAVDYLIRQNDPARLKAWLGKHSRAERISIIEHIRGERL